MMLIPLALICSAESRDTAERLRRSTSPLIEQLASPRFAERKRAAEQLRTQGPSTLPALKAAVTHRDAEVRAAVRRLIPKLEVEALLVPKNITFRDGETSLDEALKEIERQSGYKLSIEEGDPAKRVRLPIAPNSFWAALQAATTQTGATVRVHGLEERYGMSIAPKRRFEQVHGAFRLAAAKLHEDRDFDFAGPQDRRESVLTLTIELQVEPRFRVIGVEPARVDLAEDENGKPFARPDHPVRSEYELLSEYRTTALLTGPSAASRSIARFRGVVPVLVVVEAKRIIVTDNVLNSKGTKTEIDGDKVEVSEIKQRNGGDIYVELIVPGDRENISFQWGNRVSAEDVEGRLLHLTGMGSSRGGDYRASFVFQRSDDPKLGAAARLVIESWRIERYEIPFEFRDMPLP